MTKDELQHIICGDGEVRYGAAIQAAARYLRESACTGEASQKGESVKGKEAACLERYATENKLWQTIDLNNYVSAGAEQRVYLVNEQYVLKLNDAIYYTSWLDYLHSLLLHNAFFPSTAYQLLGFTKEKDVLYAVVSQEYVQTDAVTDLNFVKTFLEANGFINMRRNDYKNEELGIILEDLHDENVLTKEGLFYFIDTVFYLTDRY